MKLLTYGFEKDSQKYQEIVALCQSMQVTLIEAKKTDLNETVGYLLGKEGFEEKNKPSKTVFAIEYILFDDFDDEALQTFLLTLHKKGIVIDHKSRLTETSIHWPLGYLIEHIAEEHRFMKVFSASKQLLDYMEKLPEEKITPEIKKDWKHLLKLTKEKSLTEEELLEAYTNLSNQVTNLSK